MRINKANSPDKEEKYMLKYCYEFPEHEDNKDIFNKQHKYNVFIDASGYTYLGTYEEFATGFPLENEIAMKIPMGYKAILAFERLHIISGGEIIWTTRDENAWHRDTLNGLEIWYRDDSVTPSVEKKKKDLYIVLDQQGKRHFGVMYGFIESYVEAVIKAREISKETTGEFLVCKMLVYEQWH